MASPVTTYFVQFASGANWYVQSSRSAPPGAGQWIVERFDFTVISKEEMTHRPGRSMGRWSINMDNVEAVQLKRPENK